MPVSIMHWILALGSKHKAVKSFLEIKRIMTVPNQNVQKQTYSEHQTIAVQLSTLLEQVAGAKSFRYHGRVKSYNIMGLDPSL